MSQAVTIIMPAFAAQGTIAQAARSVINQTHEDWRLFVVSDDGGDYRLHLAEAGIRDERIVHLSSGRVKAGASNARNIGLDRVETHYVAVLDADDRFKPEKLARAVAALSEAPIVSTALDVVTDDFTHLRFVAKGSDRLLRAAEHKWLNLSMDTMVVWDRRFCDARYDPDLPNMTDLDFLMRLYRTSETSFHIGEPLHDYVKLKVSMSNGPGVTERMVMVKNLLLERLAEGYYPMADPGAREGMEAFLRISLEAEKTYEAAMAEHPGLLFEVHLEPRLRAARHAG